MRFSIIIPTYNRPGPLDRCLAAIDSLDYPRNEFEVLVVDDGSVPEPREIIARHPNLPLRYFAQHREGPAKARNRGLRQAVGEFVVFTDDDCTPCPDWLNAFSRGFAEHPAAGLGGKIVDAPENRIYGITSQMLVTFLYDYDAARPGNLRFFCSNNVAFPRLGLLEIGGFQEDFPLAAAEDRDICARWLERGQLHFVPEAMIRHHQNLDLHSFYSQHYRYGRGAFQFWTARTAEGHPGVRVEPLRFYWSMLSFPFGREPFPKAAIMLPLMVLSQVAYVAGYFSERWTGASKRN